MAYITHGLRSQMTTLPYPSHPFAGQTIIVTGANTGLGFEAAKHFVRLGATKVIIACRSATKGEKAKQQIEAETDKSNVVEVWSLDLSANESIKQFAKRSESLDRIDAVVENAGIATSYFSKSENGDESTIAVNVVGTMLLCCLMIPVLEKSAQRWNIQPRLSIVTSEVHHMTTFPESEKDDIFAELANEKTANMNDRLVARTSIAI